MNPLEQRLDVGSESEEQESAHDGKGGEERGEQTFVGCRDMGSALADEEHPRVGAVGVLDGPVDGVVGLSEEFDLPVEGLSLGQDSVENLPVVQRGPYRPFALLENRRCDPGVAVENGELRVPKGLHLVGQRLVSVDDEACQDGADDGASVAQRDRNGVGQLGSPAPLIASRTLSGEGAENVLLVLERVTGTFRMAPGRDDALSVDEGDEVQTGVLEELPAHSLQ